MTRKDYALAAAAVHSTWIGCENADQRAAVRAMVVCLVNRYKEDNPRFDAEKFTLACFGDGA